MTLGNCSHPPIPDEAGQNGVTKNLASMPHVDRVLFVTLVRNREKVAHAKWNPGVLDMRQQQGRKSNGNLQMGRQGNIAPRAGNSQTHKKSHTQRTTILRK